MPEGLNGGRGGRFLSRAISSFRAWLSRRRLLLSRRSCSTSCSRRSILPARSETSWRIAFWDRGLAESEDGADMHLLNHRYSSEGIAGPPNCPDYGFLEQGRGLRRRAAGPALL